MIGFTNLNILSKFRWHDLIADGQPGRNENLSYDSGRERVHPFQLNKYDGALG